MLSFFRRFINSKLGLVITFAVLGLIALAFAAGDVTGLRHSSSSGLTAKSVASVGGASIGEAQLRDDVRNALKGEQQRTPGLTMEQFLAGGGLEDVLNQSINGIALEQFAGQQGMIVSKRSIDGQIASIPAFQGPNGKFDDNAFRSVLAQQRMSEATLRTEMTQQTFAQQLIAPTLGAREVPQALARTYANLLLEKRSGLLGLIPVSVMNKGPAPTDAEVQAWYSRNLAKYTVPQRRIARYALVSSDLVKAAATPTEAEIQAAYKQRAAQYAAVEKRDIVMVNVFDQASANALAAKAKGGAALDALARAQGQEPQTFTQVDKAAFTKQTSSSAADAAFGAVQGAIVGPIKTAIGWSVIKVAKVSQIAAKTLDQVRPDLTKEIGAQKLQQAFSDLHDRIDGAATGGATFDEIVKDNKLSPLQSPALAANGSDPDNAAFKLDPKLAGVIQAAFQSEQGDDPQVVPTGQDGSFAVVALGKIVPAAPRPLASIRDVVARDFALDRAAKAARALAAQIMNRVNAGTPLAVALQQSGVALPAPQALSSSRMDVAKSQRAAPPPLALMFAMSPKKAKILQADQGWAIVYLDHIDKGDASHDPQTLTSAQGELARGFGNELAQQFTQAVKTDIGTTRSPTALARVRAELNGQAPAGDDSQ